MSWPGATFHRICVVLQVIWLISLLFNSEWLTAYVLGLAVVWQCIYDYTECKLRAARRSRNVTHTVEVHQRSGESTEVFARRVLDECRRVDVWTKP